MKRGSYYFTDITLAFLLGVGVTGLLLTKYPLAKVSITDILGVILAAIGMLGIFKGFEQWKLDKLLQLHINFRDERTRVLRELDVLNDKKGEDKEYSDGNRGILFSDLLNELEMIAKLVLKNKIEEEWTEDFFKTWLEVLKAEEWVNSIVEAQQDDPKAYEYLIKLGLRWEVISSENLLKNIPKEEKQ